MLKLSTSKLADIYSASKRSNIRPLVTIDVRAATVRHVSDDARKIVVLIATIDPRSRGIRLRTAGGPASIYAFTRPAAMPQRVKLFGRHGVVLDGQVTRTCIPHSLGYIYLENAPIEPLCE